MRAAALASVVLLGASLGACSGEESASDPASSAGGSASAGAAGKGGAGASGAPTAGASGAGAGASAGASGASGDSGSGGDSGGGQGGEGGEGGGAGSAGSGGSAGAGGAGGDSGSSGTSGQGGAGAPDCAGLAVIEGGKTSTVEIPFEGIVREYMLHVPAGYDATRKTPVVMSFHGFGNSAERQAEIDRFNDLADQRGFLAIHTQGRTFSPAPSCWNAAGCCTPCATVQTKDVEYAEAVLDSVEEKFCVDKARVFAAGHSNGGMMVERLGCRLASRLAAIGDVSGLLLTDECDQSKQPIPIVNIHGTSDEVVKYNGGAPKMGVDLPFVQWPSVPDIEKKWAGYNGCTDEPATVFEHGSAVCKRRSACQQGAVVEFCAVTGGGHSWPGGPPQNSDSIPVSMDIDASVYILDFFEAHPKP